MASETEISITAATPADVGLILDFIGKLAEYEHLSQEMHATAALLREHLFGARPAAEALIARVGSAAAGFALFFSTFSTFVAKPGIWLEDLFVLPEHRRLGVGKKLLRRVAEIAVERGCGRLEWSVLDWNEPALELYRTMGAEPMSEWTTQRLSGDAIGKLARGELTS